VTRSADGPPSVCLCIDALQVIIRICRQSGVADSAFPATTPGACWLTGAGAACLRR
jgi:hypothetical protein